MFVVLKQKIRILKWLDIKEKQTATFYLEIWQENSENCILKTRSRLRFSNEFKTRSRFCMQTLDSKNVTLKLDLAIHATKERERGRKVLIV